jgi:Leucine-rich repeat (LRR) protein
MQLYKLKTLQISNNDLNSLDPRLSLLPELTRISIEGNPLKSIKPSVRSANAVQLKQYLKTRLDESRI